jgi:hypothetical protein
LRAARFFLIKAKKGVALHVGSKPVKLVMLAAAFLVLSTTTGRVDPWYLEPSEQPVARAAVKEQNRPERTGAGNEQSAAKDTISAASVATLDNPEPAQHADHGPAVEQGKARSENTQKADDNPKITDWMQGGAAIVQAATAIVVTVFTVFLYRTSRKMSQVAEDQAETTRSTLEVLRLQLRAYVNVASIQAIKDEDRPGVMVAMITTINVGQTPAYDVVHLAGIAGAANDCPIQPDFTLAGKDIKRGTAVMRGGGKSTLELPTAGPLRPDQEAGVKSDTDSIYVFGEITYRDTFGVAHFTRYRARVSGEGSDRGLFKYTEEGNEAD